MQARVANGVANGAAIGPQLNNLAIVIAGYPYMAACVDGQAKGFIDSNVSENFSQLGQPMRKLANACTGTIGKPDIALRV